MMQYQKVVVVIGGSGGIGSAIIEKVKQENHYVISASKKNDSILADISMKFDLRNESAVCDLISGIVSKYGHIDCLINSAGVYSYNKLSETSSDLFNEIMSVNLTGSFYMIREVLPHMVKQNYGRIVNIASIVGKYGYEHSIAYAISKHALIGLTRCVALEIANKKITCNAICPGFVDTKMLDNGFYDFSDSTGRSASVAKRKMILSNPQKRIILPEEVASLVNYLISDEAEGINGQSINLCGGSVFY